MFGRRLTDAEVEAFSKIPDSGDTMGALAGMLDLIRELASEAKRWRELLSPKDVELLQVMQGVLQVEIEDSEKQRDEMKGVFQQFSDMCQGSVEDYQACTALLDRLIKEFNHD